MLRYRLDELGWFHFEQLVQSLLKAELGIQSESWGGRGDFGRDAYAKGPVSFPHRSVPEKGPTVFQVKYVQAANSAGAVWQPLLRKGIKSELAEIEKRRAKGTWANPRCYVLITNCPLTGKARNDIEALLNEGLSKVSISLLGALDVCDLLDKHETLRRSFPEILSLRDLDLLLSETVNREILERSRAAIEETRDLVPVFVRTGAYDKAWSSLQKHSFVVLDGPPEMGKTAIARTIALTLLFDGWQVIDCRNSDDFFSARKEHNRQVFVADDAFGRTEYDPILGRMWERDLPRIYHRLGPKHRLVWTTRKHILLRALREMDLTGSASNFPQPSEVIVTAGDLSTEEKARILYRHAKAARLEDKNRALIRDTAVSIVSNQHFTPERIRRLINELPPSKTGNKKEQRDVHVYSQAEILESIMHPTARMRKTFRKLPRVHKWVLTMLLEFDRAVEPNALITRYTTHWPTTAPREIEHALDDLIGTFLKIAHDIWRSSMTIDWIHPSYRDLVIDELFSDHATFEKFVAQTTISGLRVSLSEVSGATGGKRGTPSIRPEGWKILETRAMNIARTASDERIGELLQVLSSSGRGPAVTNIRRLICENVRTRWDERGEAVTLDALIAFHLATSGLTPVPIAPKIEETWREMCDDALRETESAFFDPDVVYEWCRMVDFVGDWYPDLDSTTNFLKEKAIVEEALETLANRQVAEAEQDHLTEEIATRFELFAEALDSVSLLPQTSRKLQGLAESFREEEDATEDKSTYLETPRQAKEDFDVAALFEDL